MMTDAFSRQKTHLPGPVILFCALLWLALSLTLLAGVSLLREFTYGFPSGELWDLALLFFIGVLAWIIYVLRGIFLRLPTGPRMARRSCLLLLIVNVLFLLGLLFLLAFEGFRRGQPFVTPGLLACAALFPIIIGMRGYFARSTDVCAAFETSMLEGTEAVPFAVGFTQLVCAIVIVQSGTMLLIVINTFAWGGWLGGISYALCLICAVRLYLSLERNASKDTVYRWLGGLIAASILVHGLSIPTAIWHLGPTGGQFFLGEHFMVFLFCWWLLSIDKNAASWFAAPSSPSGAAPKMPAISQLSVPGLCFVFLVFMAGRLPVHVFLLQSLLDEGYAGWLFALVGLGGLFLFCAWQLLHKTSFAIPLCQLCIVLGIGLEIAQVARQDLEASRFIFGPSLAALFLLGCWMAYFMYSRQVRAVFFPKKTPMEKFAAPPQAVFVQIFCVWAFLGYGVPIVVSLLYELVSEGTISLLLTSMLEKGDLYSLYSLQDYMFSELDVLAWVYAPLACLWASRKQQPSFGLLRFCLGVWVCLTLAAAGLAPQGSMAAASILPTIYLALILCAITAQPEPYLWVGRREKQAQNS